MNDNQETEKSVDDSLAIVRAFYKNALPMDETFERVLKVLKTDYDLDPKSIMRADCTCADDANAIQEPENIRQMLGPFKMGGLNGFPFTGAVGMGAYAHHVPDDGALFIYYAPHIGIGRSGEPGKIRRVGQRQPSGSCGAAIAALGNLMDGKIKPGAVSPYEFQFNTIEQIFLKAESRIKDSDQPLVAATEAMYDAIENRINLHVSKLAGAVGEIVEGIEEVLNVDIENPTIPGKYLILMGGILINGDEEMGAFNDCRRFEIIESKTGKRHDLLGELQAV